MTENIEINANAIRLRKIFGYNSESPIDIFSILKNQDNLTIVFYPMSERISGICLKVGDDGLIAINSALTVGRQKFTAAHELCHMYFHEMQKTMICDNNIGKNKDRKEVEADRFASYFIAPYESFIDYMDSRCNKKKDRISLEDIVRTEQYFGFSRQAVLWRLVNEGYLNSATANTMKTGIIKSALDLGFDKKLYLPTPKEEEYFTFGKYVRLADKLKEKDRISNGKYEELLMTVFRSDMVYGSVKEGEAKYDATDLL
jgi:Zn-dependent peptidase ImmA (M78 family)